MRVALLASILVILGATAAMSQQARTVPDCSGVVRAPGDNGGLTVDQNGRLCISAGVAMGQTSSASAASGGIASFSRIPLSAASTNLTTAKASAGRAYTYQGCNTTASTIYLRVYNAASTGAVTVGTTIPLAGPYAFPANTCVQATSFADAIGLYASNGLTYAFGMSPMDTDAAGIGSGAITAFQIGFQ